ncbi:MAG: biopolymer transporter ExbD [Polynucleobacter sp.]|nr:biopolymer transporter ExbD [Polynucleobacter sp.]
MAFGSLGKDNQDVMSEINMTPFVDVMLVLLIIFIVTVPVMTHSLELSLPNAASQAQADKSDVLRLVIDANGRYWLDQQLLNEKSLGERLIIAAEKNPLAPLHIYGDKTVPYAFVASAMAMAHRAGLSKIGFVTDPQQN